MVWGTVALLAVLLLGACNDSAEWPSRNDVLTARTTPNVEAGRQLVDVNGCGACHMIPGIPEADALAAPPLIGWSQRKTIAGVMPNSWENTVAWVMDPHAFQPGTAMPNVGLTRLEAEAVADYLFTLARDEGGLQGFVRRLQSPFE
jgi:mono/diheme cytochrome c family protein